MQTNHAVQEPDADGLAVVHPRSEEAIGRSALRKASMRLLPLIGVGYGIAYMDRVNVSFAALQMNQQLHFSAAVFGLGAGLFFLPYAALEIPSNLMLLRFGARRWLARIMFTWGLLSMGMIFVRTPLEFYTGRLLLGAAEAGFFPGIIFYLSRWFPAKDRAKAVSRFYIAFPLASTVMGALAGSLMHLDGRGHLAGWQWLLLMEGLPAVAMSLVFLVALPDGPSQARWLTDAERGWIARELEEPESRGDGQMHGTMGAFRDPRVWLVGMFLFCLYVATYGYTFIAPSLVRQVTGLQATGVGMIIAGLGILGAAAMLLNGGHSDRKGERYWHILLPVVLMAPAFVAAGFSSRAAVVIAALAVVMIGFNAFQGPLWTIPTSFLQGRSAAAGIATVNMIAILGGFAGPYWMGLSAGRMGGYQRGLVTLAAPILVAAVLITMAHRYGERKAAAAIHLPSVAAASDTGD
ncbi:MAG TPA: MFS transporter [Acidobacteriaceae bacterium]|jgi:ACS family tartrate transporter-like MFS transporter|nr:MFS transporter [Acidobacteriaceae bacterium]